MREALECVFLSVLCTSVFLVAGMLCFVVVAGKAMYFR